jgi:hypothetical protein
MVALARDVRPPERPCVYHEFLRRMDDDDRLRKIRDHHAECIRVIDARLGELRPACWDRRQWSDLALSLGFGGAFAFWLCLIGWTGQRIWSLLVD